MCVMWISPKTLDSERFADHVCCCFDGGLIFPVFTFQFSRTVFLHGLHVLYIYRVKEVADTYTQSVYAVWLVTRMFVVGAGCVSTYLFERSQFI